MGRWKRWNGTTWVGQDGDAAASAAEYAYWQMRAALLDPLAYVILQDSAVATTVPVGETWYMVSGWRMLGAGSRPYMHRVPDAAGENVIALKAGTVINLENVPSAGVYVCKPALVIGSDARYADDPRGLYYRRLQRMEAELTTSEIGHANTGATIVSSTFPTDFTYGIVTHCSTHDLAWTIMRDATGVDFGLNLNNEISDSNRIRFGERICVPFARAAMPYIQSQGVSQAEGNTNVRYVKLPADW